MPDLEERSALLRQMQLFRDLDDDQTTQIADRLLEFTLAEGETLYQEGDPASNFYVIYEGALRVWRRRDEVKEELAVLEEGDHVGEEELVFGGARVANVSAAQDALILYFDEENYQWLLDKHPRIAGDLQVFARSYRMARRLNFLWLGEDEVIYLINRRHWFHLLTDLLLPLGITLFSGVFWLLAYFSPTQATLFGSLAIAVVILFIGSALIIWQFLDWLNDYFIVTSQRVTWLEQVILQSASRHEAPVATIQTVNVRTNQLGRILGYGDVNVRTFTGRVTMSDVPNPHRMKGQIEQLQGRLRKKTEEAKAYATRQAIRNSLGIQNGEQAEEEQEPPAPEVATTIEPTVERHGGLFRFFKVREIEGDVITYHRHWYVLFLHLWPPTAFLLVVSGLAAYLTWRNMSSAAAVLPSPFAIIIFLTFFVGAPIGLILYRYFDWRNDIYRLTSDSLIDREKKPLGTEITKSAPLANVLSLQNSREGILGILLNFGTVTINVGDTSLDFLNVHNPPQVQQDIFLRMEALKRRTQEEEEARERARMVDVIRTYHDIQNHQPDA